MTRNPLTLLPASDLFPAGPPPFPGWERRIYRLPRPVLQEDIMAFLGGQELYTREAGGRTIRIIPKYGLLEIHCITGEPEIEVWFSPGKAAYSLDYVEALLATRF
jgi:hypothetical protein